MAQHPDSSPSPTRRSERRLGAGRGLVLLVVSLVVSLVVAGCGISDGPASHRVDPDDAPASTSTTAPDPSAPAGPAGASPTPAASQPDSPTTTTTLPRNTPRLPLSDADNGRTITVAPGTELIISLVKQEGPNSVWKTSSYTSSQFKFLGQENLSDRTVLRFLTVSGDPASLELSWKAPDTTAVDPNAPKWSIIAHIR